jgi:Tfp pilus assembly protein PilX
MKSSEYENIRTQEHQNTRTLERRSSTPERYFNKGQVVIIMLVIAMLVGIVIPAFVYMSGSEAKRAVGETKNTRAFNLAEVGLDRGVFKLNETGIWDIVCAGISVFDYNGQTIYSDIEGGYYKIKISSGPNQNEVTITASGKDLVTGECRTIQAVYYKETTKKIKIKSTSKPVKQSLKEISPNWNF